MTPERWQQVERLYLAAITLEAGERDIRLRAAASGVSCGFLEREKSAVGKKRTSQASDTKIWVDSQEIAVLIAHNSTRRRHYLSFVAMECLRCVITAYIKSRRDPRGSARSS